MANGRGGARSGAGRKPGSKNRLTQAKKATLTELAQALTDEAVQTLADIMRDVQNPPAARITAANSLLDRGHGKPMQAMEIAGPEGGPVQTITRRVVDPSGD